MAGNGGEIAVTYEALTHTAKDIRDAANTLATELETMKQAVNKVSEGWVGEAHEAMKHAENVFHQRAERIKAALEKVAKLVESGSEHYQITDKKAAALFQL
ncbi:WXG100 family type VII secretion target [Streptomyces orinoci]|uniref:ESAT-6-like protein n=1 Tax=Streptomyces orinoci TaxID=67339 RepID=A0ABV3K5X1_STRON|nr:WXG100 family type VII secretion target [Streptomyces orinoci]